MESSTLVPILANYTNRTQTKSIQTDVTIVVLTQIYRGCTLYVVPIIIIVGLTGNLVTFSVFTLSYLRRLSSSTYLAALAVADFLFLFCAGVSWMNVIKIRWYHQTGWCQLFVFTSYASSFLSVWFTVGFTTERYIAVCIPLRRQEMCTKRRARMVVGLLCFSALLFYSNTLFTTGTVPVSPNLSQCSILPPYIRWLNIMTNIDTILTLVIPVFTIVILNIKIMKIVYNFYRNYKGNKENQSSGTYLGRLMVGVRTLGTNAVGYRLPPGETKDSNVSSTPSGEKESDNKSAYSLKERDQNAQYTLVSTGSRGENLKTSTSSRTSMTSTAGFSVRSHSSCHTTLSQVRVTKMLVVVSSAFVVLNLPSHAIRLYYFYMFLKDEKFVPSTKCALIYALSEQLYYLNFACNVFLYSVSGKNFRLACRQLWGRLGYKVKRVFITCCPWSRTCNRDDQNSRLRRDFTVRR